MRDPSREKIIYSSLRGVIRYGSDADFPAPAPSLGILVKRKNFGGASEIITHLPRISSLIEGEIHECKDEELDIAIRQQLLMISEYCGELANYLLDEKKRFEIEAKKELLIDSVEDFLSSGKDRAISKNHADSEQISRLPRSRLPINLDAFRSKT